MSDVPTDGWTLDGEKLNGDVIQIQMFGKHEMLANLEGASKINPIFALADQGLKEKTQNYQPDVRMVLAYVISSVDRILRPIAMVGRAYGNTKWSVLWPAGDMSWRDPAFKRGFARLIRRMAQTLAESLGNPLEVEELDRAERCGEEMVAAFPQSAPQPMRAGRYKINPDGSTGAGPSKWS
jgi:hypothetical protein